MRKKVIAAFMGLALTFGMSHAVLAEPSADGPIRVEESAAVLAEDAAAESIGDASAVLPTDDTVMEDAGAAADAIPAEDMAAGSGETAAQEAASVIEIEEIEDVAMGADLASLSDPVTGNGEAPADVREDSDLDFVGTAGPGEGQAAQIDAADFAGAVTVQMDHPRPGSISDGNPENYYRFSIPQSGTVHLGGKSTNISRMKYVLYNERGDELWSIYLRMNEATGVNPVDADLVLAKGTFYLKAMQQENSSGTYEFTLSHDATTESFPEVDGGSNNSLAAASPIKLGEQYTGQIALNDAEDYYRFTLDAVSNVTVEIPRPAYSLFGILNEDGDEIAGVNHNYSFSVHLTKGTYYVKARKQEVPVVYTLKVSAEPDEETFQESGWGTNNSLPVASPIKLNKEYSLQIAANDNCDVFKFDLTETQKVTLHVSDDQLRWELYNVNGSVIWWDEATMQWVYSRAQDYEIELEAGTYYLRAYADNYDDRGSYSFSIFGYQPDSAQISSLENTSSGVKLTWKSVEGATGYRIYRKGKTGGYELIKNVTKGTATRYTDKSAKDGVTYKYKMRTVEGTYMSVYSTVQKIVCLSRPKIAKLASSASGSAAVTIKSGSKVSGYEIQYAYNSKFSGSAVRTTGKKSYTLSGLSRNSVCYVRVRSYKKTGKTVYYSAWSKKTKVRVRR